MPANILEFYYIKITYLCVFHFYCIVDVLKTRNMLDLFVYLMLCMGYSNLYEKLNKSQVVK